MIARRIFFQHLLLAIWVTALIGCVNRQESYEAANEVKQSNGTTSMKYDNVSKPNELGYSIVKVGEGTSYAEGVIDSKGVEIIAPSTQMLINNLSGKRALVQRERDFVFVDLDQGPQNQQKLQSLAKYQYAEPYDSGYAMVQINDRRFYVNEQQQNTFGTDYDFAASFQNNRALVKQGEQYSIIDTSGNIVAELSYDQVNPQSPWVWQVTRIVNDEYLSGFVDLDGREVAGLEYDEVGYYDPEIKRIRVGKGDRYGFLDEYAKVVIPVQFEYAEIFHRGKARVMLNGRTFFIDPNGNEVPE